ncbi:uncharacterized protein MONOS_18537 [Monocercomonoides exilis]|uniref:uncharacterized protein n=1 Tax=Monocercomonoides exilis TaxID=2049356 RepID=UPI00355A8455|nr:hypothetical protein MONOS_18537 [Monocercomonoides exilis]
MKQFEQFHFLKYCKLQKLFQQNQSISKHLFHSSISFRFHLPLLFLPSHSLNSFISTTSSSSSTSTFTNININLIPSFSFHSSLSIHSTIFIHTHNPIDGAILPNLNSPSTSLSAFNTSFLSQTQSSSNDLEKYIGSETQKLKLERMYSFNLNSHCFEWCEWKDSNGGTGHGGALYVECTNANLTITSCSFNNCSIDGYYGGALYSCGLQNENIAKSNFTNCSAQNGGAICIDGRESSSIYSFSDNRVESCSITSTIGTGWYFFIGDFSSNGQFLFTKCKCISNSGGDSAGSLTFNDPPANKPNQFSINECQFINNKLTSSSTSWGGAAIFFYSTFSWMNGMKFITFCFFDGNTATNGRGNDVFFSGNSITQSPFQQCGSTTPSKRVWNQGTAENAEYNGWLPIINQNKIVSNSGTDVDACGKTQQSPCATVEYALGCVAPFSDASLSLLVSTFTPTNTLTFSAVDTKFTVCYTIFPILK